MAFPRVRHLYTPQIGVTVEGDPEKIVNLAFSPIGGFPKIADGGQMRIRGVYAAEHAQARWGADLGDAARGG